MLALFSTYSNPLVLLRKECSSRRGKCFVCAIKFNYIKASIIIIIIMRAMSEVVIFVTVCKLFVKSLKLIEMVAGL